MTTEVLIVLGSASDLPCTNEGTALLESLEISFSLRICSAHRSPTKLDKLVKAFIQEKGRVIICVAGMSAHLAGVTATLTTCPVLAVPVSRPETSGFDALLSMSQMPAGIPVATFGFGRSGFTNSCLFAVQILAGSSPRLLVNLQDHRKDLEERVRLADEQYRKDFQPNGA